MVVVSLSVCGFCFAAEESDKEFIYHRLQKHVEVEEM